MAAASAALLFLMLGMGIRLFPAYRQYTIVISMVCGVLTLLIASIIDRDSVMEVVILILIFFLIGIVLPGAMSALDRKLGGKFNNNRRVL